MINKVPSIVNKILANKYNNHQKIWSIPHKDAIKSRRVIVYIVEVKKTKTNKIFFLNRKHYLSFLSKSYHEQ